MSDFTLRIAGDNKQFLRSLEETKDAANRSMGQVGKNIDKQTDGVRRLGRSLSGTVGIFRQFALPITVASGLVGGFASAWSKARNEVRETEKEIQSLTRSTRDFIDSLMVGRGARSGLSAEGFRSFDSIQNQIDELSKRAKELRGSASFTQGVGVFGQLGAAFGISNDPISRLEQAARLESQIVDLRREQGEQFRAVLRRESESVSNLEQELSSRRQLAALEREGNDFEVQRFRVRIEGESEIRRLVAMRQKAELDGQDILVDRIQKQIELTRDEFRERISFINKLESESAAATQAEIDRQSSTTRMESERQAEALSGILEENRLRALGLDQEAERLRIENERKQTLEQINNLQLLSSDQRETLIRQAEELAFARLSALGASPDQVSSSTRPMFGPSVQGGVGLTAARQVLGGGQQQSMERQQTNSLKSLESDVRSLVPVVRDISRQQSVAVFN